MRQRFEFYATPNHGSWLNMAEIEINIVERHCLAQPLHDLETLHRRIKVRHPQTNGFVERFHCTVKEEFFEVTLREPLYPSTEALQDRPGSLTGRYNTECPHLGYRNLGKRPLDTVSAYLAATQEAS